MISKTRMSLTSLLLFLLTYTGTAVCHAQSYPVEGLSSGTLLNKDAWSGSGNVTVDNVLHSPLNGSTQSIRLRGNSVVRRYIGRVVNSGPITVSYDLYMTPRMNSMTNQTLVVGFDYSQGQGIFAPYAQDGGGGIAQNGFVDVDGLGGQPFLPIGGLVAEDFRYQANRWYRFEFLLDFDNAQVSDFKIYDISSGGMSLVASRKQPYYFNNNGTSFYRNWDTLTLFVGGTYANEGSNFDNLRVGPLPPVAPSNLTATTAPSRAIQLRWKDNSDNEDHFNVESEDEQGNLKIAVLPPNTTSYLLTGLEHNQKYSFRVYATNQVGRSEKMEPVAQFARTYVLLIHGLYGNGDKSGWGSVYNTLVSAGYRVETIDFTKEAATNNSNNASIVLQSTALSARIRKMLEPNKDGDIDIVAHSMGGLAARYYLEKASLWANSGGKYPAGVRKLVTLGTPHWGTDAVLADPLSGLIVAKLNKKSDTIFDWSDAIKDMFAEWMIPSSIYRYHLYPANYSPSLGRWLLLNGKWQSPIKADADKAAYDWALSALSVVNSPALSFVLDAEYYFRPDNRTDAHEKYYVSSRKVLGPKRYPNVATGIEGVDTRFVSAFLYDLNVTLKDNSHARIYLMGGKRPNLFQINPFFAGFFGPFTIDNDGVVPVKSALGIDPITGNRLFPNADWCILEKNHIELQKDPNAAKQVELWLNESLE